MYLAVLKGDLYANIELANKNFKNIITKYKKPLFVTTLRRWTPTGSTLQDIN